MIIKQLILGLVSILVVGQLADSLSLKKFIRKGPVIKTKSGSIQGRISTSRDGREFYEWLKIPYAKAPIGSYRFSSPQPIEKKWSGVRDGSRYGASCVQNIFYLKGFFMGKEDCLFLNVHIPKALHDQKKLLPVLFYIHGGAFIFGGSNTYRPNFLMDEDIVFVTINYRLDIFGFLTTGDKVIRGNMGLKDQVQALKWVKENIQSFGGDPYRITIIGHSAGGASVHHLLLSPMTKGLFVRAISNSGAASNTWGLKSLNKSVAKTQTIGVELGCPISDTQKLASCLRNASVADLMRTVWIDIYESPLLRPNKFGSPMVPTIEAVDDEDAFLTRHPLKIVAEGKAHRVPWLVGHTADEGLLSLAQLTVDDRALLDLEKNIYKSIKSVFALEHENSNETAEAIHEFYFPPSQRSNLTRDQKLGIYTKLFSDGFFNFDIRESIFYQRQFSAVYPYFFNQKDGPSMWTWWKRIMSGDLRDLIDLARHAYKTVVSQYFYGTELPEEKGGIAHFQDTFMLFPLKPFIHMSKTSRNYKFSKDYIKLIADFASKDESDLLTFAGLEFPPTPKEGPLMFFEITNERPGVIREPFEDRMSFLHDLNIRIQNVTTHA